MHTLVRLSKDCETVVELGVRDAVSTFAFINGLKQNEKDKKILHCVDICEVPDYQFIQRNSKKDGVKVKFHKESSLNIDLDDIDMVFIDTWHVYAQLKRELEKYGPITKKYIVMHDTEVDKIDGEVIRLKQDVKKLSEESGYSVEELSCGLGKAIVDFLMENEKEWKLTEHYVNNNGLTILKRKTLEEDNEMVQVYW
jgi:hypothetical protein